MLRSMLGSRVTLHPFPRYTNSTAAPGLGINSGNVKSGLSHADDFWYTCLVWGFLSLSPAKSPLPLSRYVPLMPMSSSCFIGGSVVSTSSAFSSSSSSFAKSASA